MGKFIDLTGRKFERLTVIERTSQKANKHILWMCACDCGEYTVVTGRNLITDNTRSCGCLRAEVAASISALFPHRTHGKSNSSIYKIWCGMIHRCTNPNEKAYRHYGGRGITICQGWLNSFESFYADMGERPESRSIDRIDNEDGYHCGHCEECKSHGWKANCRWATAKEQCNNKRNNKRVLVNGSMITLLEASQISGMPVKTLDSRLRRGWTDEKLLLSTKKATQGIDDKKTPARKATGKPALQARTAIDAKKKAKSLYLPASFYGYPPVRTYLEIMADSPIYD